MIVYKCRGLIDQEVTNDYNYWHGNKQWDHVLWFQFSELADRSLVSEIINHLESTGMSTQVDWIFISYGMPIPHTEWLREPFHSCGIMFVEKTKMMELVSDMKDIVLQWKLGENL